MGCFPKCFTTCKRRKHNKSVTVSPFKHHAIPPLPTVEKATEAEVVPIQAAAPTKLEDSLNAIKPIKESKEEVEEQLKEGVTKKVTFDLNVKAHDLHGLVEMCDEKENDKKEETPKEIEPILGSVVSSVVVVASHPLSHRYENCENSEEEDEDMVGLEGSDLNEEVDYEENVDGEFESRHISIQEESSESLFSLSIDSRKHQVCDAETDEKEVNSTPMPKQQIGSNQSGRDRRSLYCQSVLNPIENLTQWKEVVVNGKATPTASKHQDKENMHVEPTLNLSKLCTRPKSNDVKIADAAAGQGTGVDTSLSSWLVESETTPKSNASNNSVGNSSSRRHEDGLILGAWTSEELKQLSASCTPKRSRSPSPEEMPILGTVASYWSHTGQTLDLDSSSSCREDQQVKGKKNTPFEVQLERALDMGV